MGYVPFGKLGPISIFKKINVLALFLQSVKPPNKNWAKDSASHCVVRTSKSGWMNSELLEAWFDAVVVPWAEDKEGEKAVFLDNCSAHFSENVIKKCEELKIKFIPLPPNSTWLTQPCDVAVFKGLKTAWHQAIGDFNDERKRNGQKPHETLPRASFIDVLELALAKMRTARDGGMARVIFSAFRVTGIAPLNRDIVLKTLPTLASSCSTARDDAVDEVRSVVGSDASNDLMRAFVDSTAPSPSSSRAGRALGEPGVPLTMATHK
jgi:hypothetical protein